MADSLQNKFTPSKLWENALLDSYELHMDPTSHIAPVKLFHYLIHAMPLSESERDHLQKCSYCQSLLEEWDTYVDPGMIHAA